MITHDDALALFEEVCPRRKGETADGWHRRIAREFGLGRARVSGLIYDKRLKISADDIGLIIRRVLKHRGVKNGETLDAVTAVAFLAESEVTRQERDLLHEIEKTKAALRTIESRLQQRLHGMAAPSAAADRS